MTHHLEVKIIMEKIMTLEEGLKRMMRLEVEKFDLKLGWFSILAKSIYGRRNIHDNDSSKR